MNTPNIESEVTGQAVAQAEEPKATKKTNTGARKPRVAASKPKSGKKASKAEKASKKPKGAKPPKAGEGAREGSKAAKVRVRTVRPLSQMICWW